MPALFTNTSTNATGTFLCTKAFLDGMLDRGWGRVINVSSVAGLRGGRYIAAYTASKHAQIGFTRALALEVADQGITVNAICPGYVDTPMTEFSVSRIVEKTGISSEEALDRILALSPQRRFIRPEEIAHAALMLCTQNGEGINGQTIVIDGGQGGWAERVSGEARALQGSIMAPTAGTAPPLVL